MSSGGFKMMARASDTGLVYYWTFIGGDADWSGSEYPGTGTPEGISVVGQRPGVVSDPIPSADGKFFANVTVQSVEEMFVPDMGTFEQEITPMSPGNSLDLEFSVTLSIPSGSYHTRYRVITQGPFGVGNNGVVQTIDNIITPADLAGCPTVDMTFALDAATGVLTATATNTSGVQVAVRIGHWRVEETILEQVPGPVASLVGAEWDAPVMENWSDQFTNPVSATSATGGTGSGFECEFDVDPGAPKPFVEVDNLVITNPGTGYLPGDVITVSFQSEDPYNFEFDVTVATVS